MESVVGSVQRRWMRRRGLGWLRIVSRRVGYCVLTAVLLVVAVWTMVMGWSGWHAESVRKTASTGRLAGASTGVASFDSWQLHEAGHVREGAVVRHVFGYRNPTGSVLRVAAGRGVRKSCGCTTATLADMELRPGQATALSVEVETQGKRGAVQEVVHVDWVDEQGAVVEAGFGMRATVDAVVVWSPAEVMLSRQELMTGRILEAVAESDLPVDWTRAVVRSDCEYLKIREQRVVDDKRLRVRYLCLARGTGESRVGSLRIEVPLESGKASADALSAGSDRGKVAASAVGEQAGTVGESYVTGLLMVHSQDTARLRASPRRVVLRRAGDQDCVWRAQVVLTGDRVGERVPKVTAESTWGPAQATTCSLGARAVRCDVTVSERGEPEGMPLEMNSGTGLVAVGSRHEASVAGRGAAGGRTAGSPERRAKRERAGRLILYLDGEEQLVVPAVLQVEDASGQ